MKFRLLSLLFNQKVKVLLNDQWKTKDFNKKDFNYLLVGEKEVDGIRFLCGFVSSPTTIPNPKILKVNYKTLLDLDVDSRIRWIKNNFKIPELKIPKDQITDRTEGDGNKPIHLYHKSPELWSDNV